MNCVAHLLATINNRASRFAPDLHPCLWPFVNLLARVDIVLKRRLL